MRLELFWVGASMTNCRYAINGRFLTRQATGVDRYAREIVLELDKLVDFGEICLAVPDGVDLVDPPKLINVQYERIGKRGGLVWEQMDFASFAHKCNAIPVNLCNTAPLRNPGIVCVHDMQIRAIPSCFSLAFRVWYRILFRRIASKAKMIITISEFSKREIEKYYPSSKGKIEVIYAAWQHFLRVESDGATLDKYGLKKDEYYFALSSLAPNKNLKWLVETARLNPDETIAIAGGINTKVFGKHDVPTANNVKYLGYVADEEAKALMENCKCFLFPTLYEGFGIPPLEAMSVDADCLVSNTLVMHEIYDGAVCYLDPDTPCANLESLFSKVYEDRNSVLEMFSWKQSALMLSSLLR